MATVRPAITLDDHAIYFAATAPGAQTPSLYRIPKAGGDPQVLDQGARRPIVLDGPSLLYTRVTKLQSALSERDPAWPPMSLRSAAQCRRRDYHPEGPDGRPGQGASTGSPRRRRARTMLVLHWDPRTDTTAVIGSIRLRRALELRGRRRPRLLDGVLGGPGLRISRRSRASLRPVVLRRRSPRCPSPSRSWVSTTRPSI